MASPERCTVVFVADDLGIGAARNRGVLQAFQHGVVGRASLLANGEAAREAVALLAAHGLLGAVGLHLNLTEGTPLSSLPAGSPLFRGKQAFWDAAARGVLNPAQVEGEVRAQLEWFEACVGAPPARIDGHQHCHVASPVVVEALGTALADRASPPPTVRIPEERGALARPLCPACVRVQPLAAAARAKYAQFGVRPTAAAFVGCSLCGVDYSVEDLVTAVQVQVEQLGGGGHEAEAAVEVMCHPGKIGRGWDAFNQSPSREHELSVLCRPELRRQCEERGWTVVRGC